MAAAGTVFVLGIVIVVLSMPKPNGVALSQGTGALRVPASFWAKPEPPAPPVASEVVFKVVSNPAGATLLVDGVEKGPTPIEVKLPRGDQAVELTLRREGYADAVEKVTPDENQRFRVSLTREKAKGGGAAPVKQTGGGFHRFD